MEKEYHEGWRDDPEETSLSEKELTDSSFPCYLSKEVREAVSRFLSHFKRVGDVEKEHYTPEFIHQKAVEEFGEKLT